MLVGKKVNVYQKPITKEDFEGVGKIVEVIRHEKGDDNAWCYVTFPGDYPDERYWRTIFLDDIILNN